MDGVSLGRWEDSLSLGSPAECCWIIAEIDVTDDEGRSEVVTVHSRRYLADPIERD